MTEQYVAVGWQHRIRYRERFSIGPPYGDWREWSPWMSDSGGAITNNEFREIQRRQLFVRDGEAV